MKAEEIISMSKAWTAAAASIGTIEMLKDHQGSSMAVVQKKSEDKKLQDKKKKKKNYKMSSTSRAWIVAASLGSVEVLKDQGFCRWNYALRSLHQHARSNIRSNSQVKSLSSTTVSSSSLAMATKKIKDEKMKQSEESLRNVMYLSCWGPN
ncbi:hypothetical protein NE237_015920 [Protea cynaroides]|uniref:Uncharacterized protein n=1 Tax=Protea cynaroides TaxID=273540 RepID=A0A9Q0KF94_9MAGN|nr:hypothetical protein NE237_015920 [Protea cynaroides]